MDKLIKVTSDRKNISGWIKLVEKLLLKYKAYWWN
jgi:hypothetical protein